MINLTVVMLMSTAYRVIFAPCHFRPVTTANGFTLS